MASRDARATTSEPAGGILKHFLAVRVLLYRMVGRIVRPQEIEDIVQETFVLSYVASCNHEIKNPRAFMMKVARNIALDQISRTGYRLNSSIEDVDETEFLGREDAMELEYLSESRFLAFCRAVSELPVGCRRVFILKKVYGLSLKEISEKLGISESTVEKHVVKGMVLVLRYMLKAGYSTETKEGGKSKYQSSEVKSLE